VSGDDVVLPDDVVAYLRSMSSLREEFRFEEDGAGELLEKYAQGPKTLADIPGKFRFTRQWQNEEHQLSWWDEAEVPVSVHGLPWPDDGGREACELLDGGWRLIPRSALDANHEVLNPDHLESRSQPLTISAEEALRDWDVVVVAREIS
jgi:hypothetical protein